jgi:hypothetical protein
LIPAFGTVPIREGVELHTIKKNKFEEILQRPQGKIWVLGDLSGGLPVGQCYNTTNLCRRLYNCDVENNENSNL